MTFGSYNIKPNETTPCVPYDVHFVSQPDDSHHYFYDFPIFFIKRNILQSKRMYLLRLACPGLAEWMGIKPGLSIATLQIAPMLGLLSFLLCSRTLTSSPTVILGEDHV